MAYNKKTLNEELNRINEIILNTTPKNILVEQDSATRKIMGDITDKIITPSGLNKLFKGMGLEGLETFATKYLDNYKRLVNKLGDGSWDEMIIDTPKVINRTDVTDVETGRVLDVDELYDISLEDLANPELYSQTEKFFRKTAGGTLEEITQKEYDEILENSADFYSLPIFLQATKKELETLLNQVEGVKFDSIEEFMKSLNRFYQGGPVTPGMRGTIISLMSREPGFAMRLAKELLNNDTLYKKVKLYQALGKMDEIYDDMATALGLSKNSKLLDDLIVPFSKAGQTFLDWTKFLHQSWRPIRGIKDLYWGTTKSKWRTIVFDIMGGTIFDYIMGAQFIKSLFNFIKKGYTASKSANIIQMAAAFITGYALIGGYRSLRDYKSVEEGFSLSKFWSDITNSFKRDCVGKSKVQDALTGRLYNNAIGEVKGDDGFMECEKVRFRKSFLETYSIKDPNDVKIIAEGLYKALNIDSHEDHPLLLSWGDWVPSVTKYVREYIGAFIADDGYLKQLITKDGMDIIKMSQVASYYETNFDANLYKDAQNLDMWREVAGGMNFAEFSELIERLPYLDPEQSEVNFNTFQEIVKENEKSFMRYPSEFSYRYEEDGEILRKRIKLGICGTNCLGLDDNPCNCNNIVGDCLIGGTIVDADMLVALDEVGIKDQAALNALSKKSDGFDRLKKIYDETNSKLGTGCRLQPK